MSIEVLLSFLAWLIYGFRLKARANVMMEKVMKLSKPKRIFWGSGGLLLSGIILLFGMILLGKLGGFQDGKMTYWGWAVVTLFGLGFVHIQVFSALSIVSILQENRVKRNQI